MAEILLKVPNIHWDDNERTGMRHVSVSYEGVNIMSIRSDRNGSEWFAKMIPMGYSYDLEQCDSLISFFHSARHLMEYLQSTDTLTADDVNKFIDRIHTIGVS